MSEVPTITRVKKTLSWSLLIWTLSAQPLGAWDSHFLLTFAALKNMPEIAAAPDVHVETLASFVAAEKVGLAKVLAENEAWANKHVPTYPHLPAQLAFSSAHPATATLQNAFLQSIRVKPDLPFALFLQYPPGSTHRIRHSLSLGNIMLGPLVADFSGRVAKGRVEAVYPSDKVPALEVIATAADEPDYGLDIGLWQDNHTPYGDIYGFGEQPFGNPTIFFSSQAPFHMGFFHESSLLYMLAGFLKRCYPEYRIHTYLALSRYAFRSGHPYWGYRFLGWAIHHVQDLTQPYHSTVAPGTHTAYLIFVNALNSIGITSPRKAVVQKVTQEHLALEDYYFRLLQADFANPAPSKMMQALMNARHDFHYPRYDDSYPRDVVAKESHARAAHADRLMQELDSMGESIGSHTRNVVRYATSSWPLRPSEPCPTRRDQLSVCPSAPQ